MPPTTSSETVPANRKGIVCNWGHAEYVWKELPSDSTTQLGKGTPPSLFLCLGLGWCITARNCTREMQKRESMMLSTVVYSCFLYFCHPFSLSFFSPCSVISESFCNTTEAWIEGMENLHHKRVYAHSALHCCTPKQSYNRLYRGSWDTFLGGKGVGLNMSPSKMGHVSVSWFNFFTRSLFYSWEGGWHSWLVFKIHLCSIGYHCETACTHGNKLVNRAQCK